MRAYTLSWRADPPPGLIDASVLRPDTLSRLAPDQVAKLRMACGRRSLELGELFAIDGADGSAAPALSVPGCDRFVALGAHMETGSLIVEGASGHLAACGMRGGEVTVTGSAGNLAGAAMRGGILRIGKDAGRLLGGPLPGSTRGMSGGEIVVLGDAGERAGLGQHRGLIAIGGRAGRGPGHHMRAGTIVVCGGTLDAPGCGMRRGTIIGPSPPSPLSGFRETGPVGPVVFRLLARRLEALGLQPPPPLAGGELLAFSGDHLSLGRGEVVYLP